MDEIPFYNILTNGQTWEKIDKLVEFEMAKLLFYD